MLNVTHRHVFISQQVLSSPQVASLDTSPRTIRHYASFPPRKCLLDVRKMKFCPLLNIKIVTTAGSQWPSSQPPSQPLRTTGNAAICRRRWTKLERFLRRLQRWCSTKLLIPV